MSTPRATPPNQGQLSEVERLQRSVAELTEAVAARDTFIAVAAHELRNPMTAMIGQIELLLAGLQANRHAPKQLEQRLLRLRQVMEHYVKRASILLDVSRITAGKFKLDPIPFDLCELVQNVAETFADTARHAGTPIQLFTPASLPGTWDRLAVEQIIDNLVSNAIKYGGHHPVEVHAEDLGHHVQIKVRDYGPGISAHDQQRIFGRFERAVGQTEHHAGFGVGLWIVGQLVSAMEGTITVDQPDGRGTSFIVTLPRHTQVRCS